MSSLCSEFKQGHFEFKELRNIFHHKEKMAFRIYKHSSDFPFFGNNFPSVKDVPIDYLEKKLSGISRFKFDDGVVGFFDSFNGEKKISYFNSKDFGLYSKNFSNQNIYENDCYGFSLNKPFFRRNTSGILPFSYFLSSTNGVGNIFMRNYFEKFLGEETKGLEVWVGVSSGKDDGKEIVSSLSDEISSLYGGENINTRRVYFK